MSIDHSLVRHVARLANLELTSGEVGRLAGELGAILAYVEQLNDLDTSQVPPTTYLQVEAAPLRPDESVEPLPPEVAVAEGPRVQENAFSVPAFVEE